MSKRLRLYDILGLDLAADQVSIRRAYKRLSDPLLPEKNPAPDAPEQLKTLRAAYEVLVDLERRAVYDEFGEPALKKGFDVREARRKIEREAELAERRAKAALVAPTAIERRETTPEGAPVKRDWTLRIAIGRVMAKKGGLLRRPVTRPISCVRCDGSGRRDVTCKNCGGAQKITKVNGEPCAPCHGVGLVVSQTVSCRRCRGWGRRGKSICKICGGCGLTVRRLDCAACAGRGLKSIPVTLPCSRCSATGLEPCPRCAGHGTVPKSLVFKLYVPRHAAENIEYRYAGAGFSSREGVPTDLYVQFVLVARAPRR